MGHDQNIGHLARYSCIIALQRAIKKYYISSTYSYNEIKRFSSDIDFAEFSESYSVPLIRTEKLELALDGGTSEALGKMNDFAGVFDIETYNKHSFAYKRNAELSTSQKDICAN